MGANFEAFDFDFEKAWA